MMRGEPLSARNRARLRDYLDDALLRLQLSDELEAYRLPDSWHSTSIVQNLVASATSLLQSLNPDDQQLERLITDLYDARHLPIDEFTAELRRLRATVKGQDRSPTRGRPPKHVCTVPVEMTVHIVQLHDQEYQPYLGWPEIRIGLGQLNARYWFVRDPQAYAEIGLSGAGRLRAVHIVQYRRPLISMDGIRLLACSERERGIPVLSAEPWDDPGHHPGAPWIYETGTSPLTLGISQNRLIVELSPDLPTYRVRVSEQLSCGFNEQREMCGLVIEELDEQEIAFLHEVAAQESQ